MISNEWRGLEPRVLVVASTFWPLSHFRPGKPQNYRGLDAVESPQGEVEPLLSPPPSTPASDFPTHPPSPSPSSERLSDNPFPPYPTSNGTSRLHNHVVEVCAKNYNGDGGRDDGRNGGPGHLSRDPLRGLQQQHQHRLFVFAERGERHADQLWQCRLPRGLSRPPLQVHKMLLLSSSSKGLNNYINNKWNARKMSS